MFRNGFVKGLLQMGQAFLVRPAGRTHLDESYLPAVGRGSCMHLWTGRKRRLADLPGKVLKQWSISAEYGRKWKEGCERCLRSR